MKIDAPYSFDCPQCGQKLTTTLGQLRGDYHCPGCGVGFDGRKLDEVIKDLESRLDRIGTPEPRRKGAQPRNLSARAPRKQH